MGTLLWLSLRSFIRNWWWFWDFSAQEALRLQPCRHTEEVLLTLTRLLHWPWALYSDSCCSWFLLCVSVQLTANLGVSVLPGVKMHGTTLQCPPARTLWLMCKKRPTTWPTLRRSFSPNIKGEAINRGFRCFGEYFLCSRLQHFGSNTINSTIKCVKSW